MKILERKLNKISIARLLNYFSILLSIYLLIVGWRLLPFNVIVSVIIAYGIALFYIYFFIKYSFKSDFTKFGFVTKKTLPKYTKLYAILSGLAIGIFFNGFGFFFLDFTSYFQGMEMNIFQQLLLASLIGPVVEEIVFRGFIQTIIGIEMRKTDKTNFWLPIIITGALFAVVHFTALNRISLAQTIFVVIMAFVIGLLSGYFKEKFKTIIPSIYVHISANVGAMIIIMMLVGTSTSESRLQMQKRIFNVQYDFDLNDSTTFWKSMQDYSLYEKKIPEAAKGKELDYWIPVIVTVDTTGLVKDVKLDSNSFLSYHYKPSGCGLEEITFKFYRNMPRWKPKIGRNNDTIIPFSVYYYQK